MGHRRRDRSESCRAEYTDYRPPTTWSSRRAGGSPPASDHHRSQGSVDPGGLEEAAKRRAPSAGPPLRKQSPASRRFADEGLRLKPATGAGAGSVASLPPSARLGPPAGGQNGSAASFDVRRPVLDRQANCAKLRASCPFGRRALPQTSGGDVVALAGQGFERGRQQVLGGQCIPVVFGGPPPNRYPLRLQRRLDALGEDLGLAGIKARSE